MRLRSIIVAVVILLLATALLPIFAAVAEKARKAKEDEQLPTGAAEQWAGMPEHF